MSRRAERVGDLIREEVSDLIRNEIDDPRLKSGALVSVTDAEVTDDLRYAKIFVTVMGSEEQTKDVFAALKHAEAFLRKELGPRLQLRFLPEIHFFRDDSIKTGARVEELLSQLKSDKKP
jgi:ribosome-binding factor A